jgi:uncharacterized protein
MRYIREALEESLTIERKMAFIAGPRQVGKTTLAKGLLAKKDSTGDNKAGYFNWDLLTHRRLLQQRPDHFWTDPSGGARARIVLDEIHKYPRWKRFLKGLFDTQGSQLEIIVTGSGRLDLYQKGGDSLLGRYRLNRLHPFTVGELLSNGAQRVLTPDEMDEHLRAPEAVGGAEEALTQIERQTGFPEPLFSGTQERLRRWRRARRDLVLKEDLRDLTRVREIGLIDNLVALLPDRIGSPLSVNGLREDLGVAFDTAKNWLEILSRLYFLFEIRPFAGKLARTLRREGKVYLYDHTEIEQPGPRFENIVALHLHKLVDAWNDRGYGDFALHYVRDKEQREVDFLVVDGKRPYLLVEVKSGDGTVSPALRYFQERMKPKHAIQITRTGTVRRERRDAGVIVVAPADRLLALF